MAESFDAYHAWLGIAPKDQPPNHYRLLGQRSPQRRRAAPAARRAGIEIPSRAAQRPARPGRRLVGDRARLSAIAPFDAKKAREHQERWATHLGEPVQLTNSIGMKLALIPPRHRGASLGFRVCLVPDESSK